MVSLVANTCWKGYGNLIDAFLVKTDCSTRILLKYSHSNVGWTFNFVMKMYEIYIKQHNKNLFKSANCKYF